MFNTAKQLAPGLITSITIALAALFLTQQYGGSAILYALLLGMTFNFLNEDKKCIPGIQFSTKYILRLGVALLGTRITINQIYNLDISIILLLCFAVVGTIFFGLLLSSILRLPKEFGILSGCAVGICGASAALAVSAAMPQKIKHLETYTVLTILGVTTLSTIVMVLYPILSSLLGFNSFQTGVFFGGTIHDVAQVAGAGYMASSEIGDTAIIIKLLRVSLLIPVVLIISLCFKKQQNENSLNLSSALPVFLIAFIVIVVINSLGLIPGFISETSESISKGCLVTAIAALGIKTSFEDIMKGGWQFMTILIAETLFIAIIVIGALLNF